MIYLHVAKKRYFITGSAVEECVSFFEAWRDENGYGQRAIGATFPVTECTDGAPWKHEPMATVHYNGRVVVHV